MTVYIFPGHADFEVDEDAFELRLAGRRVEIEPKPLALLLELVHHPDRVLSSQELIARLWPDARVTTASLTRAVSALRGALGESARASSLVLTVRGRGYRVGAAVERVEGSPTAPPSGRPVGAVGEPFVGRHALRKDLDDAFANTDAGRSRLVFLAGEPGIGKSHVARYFATFAESRGARVAWGRNTVLADAPPYWPWVQVLRSIARSCSADERASVFGGARRAVAALDPQLVPAKGEDSRSEPPPRCERFEIFDAVTGVLRTVGAAAPLVLVLEDLHWASAASLDLLRFAAHELVDARVLAIATYRPVGAPPNPALDAALVDLESVSHARVHRLGALSKDDVRTYLTLRLPRPPAEKLVRSLARRTDGHPLFLREITNLLRPHRDDATLARVSAGDLPATLRSAIRARLEAVPEADLHILRQASVLGRRVPLALLKGLSGQTEASLFERLESLERQGLLEEVGRGEPRFSHELLREAVYRDIPANERGRLHEQAARSSETTEPEEQERRLAVLSHHFAAALVARRGDPEKALRYARRAGDHARARLAFEEASEHYARAIAALAALSGSRRGLRCDLLLDGAECLTRVGESPEAMLAIEEAAAIARRLGDADRFGRAALAMGVWAPPLFANRAAIDLLEEALALGSGRDPVQAVRLRGELAKHLQYANDAARAAELLRDAQVRARELADPVVRVDLLMEQLLIVQQSTGFGAVAERLALATELLDGALATHQLDAVLCARRQRISLYLERGDPVALDAEIGEFERGAALSQTRSHEHYACAFRGMRTSLAGDFLEARTWIDRTQRLADPLDPVERIFTPLTQRLFLPPDPELLGEQQRAVRDALSAHPAQYQFHCARALVHQAEERPAEARRSMETFERAGGAPRLLGMLQAVVAAAAARIYHWLGDARQAQGLYALLAPAAGSNEVHGMGIAYQGPFDYDLGLLADLLGRREDAAHHLEAARESSERMGARPFVARAELALARLLLRRPDASARARGRALAVRARDAATRLGMPDVLQASERLALERSKGPG